MIHPDGRQHETLRDRARVAAELRQEARQLTETAMLAPSDPEPGPRHNGNGHANGNGNGNGHADSNGNRRPDGTTYHNQLAHDIAAAGLTPAERTLADLNKAVSEAPGRVDLLLHRATQLGAMGRYSAARGDLEHALTLEPDNTAVRSALGIVLLRKGLWSQAVPHLRHVVAIESWSPTAWFYLGDALNHVDDLDGALAAFGRAAELDPHHAKALYGQGIVLDRLRRPTDAARLYRRSREVAAR
jgi:tetratricopeptide (TPR) repeat protein